MVSETQTAEAEMDSNPAIMEETGVITAEEISDHPVPERHTMQSVPTAVSQPRYLLSRLKADLCTAGNVSRSTDLKEIKTLKITCHNQL